MRFLLEAPSSEEQRKYKLKKDINGRWIAELGDDEAADKFIKQMDRASETSTGRAYTSDSSGHDEISAFDQVTYDRMSEKTKNRLVLNSLVAYCPAFKKLDKTDKQTVTSTIVDSGEYYTSHILYKLLNNINADCDVSLKFLQDVNYAYTNSNIDKKYWNEAIKTAFANPSFYSGDGKDDGTKAKAVVLWLSRSSKCTGELSARKHIAEWNEDEWPSTAEDVAKYVIAGEEKQWQEDNAEAGPSSAEEDITQVINNKIREVNLADSRDVLFKNYLSSYVKQSRDNLSNEAYKKLKNAVEYLNNHPEDVNEYDIKLKKILIGEYEQALKDAKDHKITLDSFNKTYVHNANKQIRVELNKYADEIAKKLNSANSAEEKQKEKEQKQKEKEQRQQRQAQKQKYSKDNLTDVQLQKFNDVQSVAKQYGYNQAAVIKLIVDNPDLTSEQIATRIVSGN